MPPPRPDAVLKVGGSLGRRPRQLSRLMAALGGLARSSTLVVVPGGGAFADEVRRADRRFALDGSSSHWMAILAMDQYAYLLRHLAPGALLVRSPEDVCAGRLNVIAPSTWLIRADPLPHSWDVTSDSIAAWVARVLRARQLILLKPLVGASPARRMPPASSRVRSRDIPRPLRHLVDGYFNRALGRQMPCWIVSGARPARVAALLARGSTDAARVSARPHRWIVPTVTVAPRRPGRRLATRSRPTRP
jgi:aspartokinase-like uncharacterized kinase